jgi:hypothetical protein
MRPSPWLFAVLGLAAASADAAARTSATTGYPVLIEAYRGGQAAALDRISAASEADVRGWIEGARSGPTWTIEPLSC